MSWVRAHPYATTLALAAILVLAGIFIITRRAGVGPQGQNLGTWGGVNVDLFDPIGAAPARNTTEDQQDLYTQVRSGPPFQYSPLPAPVDTTGEAPADDFNFDEFISMLTQPKTSSVKIDSSLGDVYSFIPGGLISTSTLTKAKTEIESAIYEYGNDAGSYIQSYDEQYRNAPQILKDQFEDRTNAAKNARLADLGSAMAGVGMSLQNIDIVPPSFEPANKSLGKSYVDMGAKLRAVAAARSDEQVLGAVMAYNASVETFTKSYVALATLFSAYGVSFKPDEAGSVFMFTNTPGL